MSAPATQPHLDADTLVAYWLGELPEAPTQAADLHLLGCDTCGTRLDGLLALGDGLRRAFDAGLVGAVIGADFVQRLADRGLRLREYHVAHNGRVNCSVAPDDDVVISRLAAPLAGLARVDIVRSGLAGEGEVRAADIPFDPARGEVVIVAPAARLRALPSGVERLRLLGVDAAGERVIGDYAFHHSAWPP